MRLRSYVSVMGTSLVMALSLCYLAPQMVHSQSGQPSVSAVTLQIMPGQGGQQCVLTPRGYVVPLPGPGTGQNAVQIFMGAEGGYWYVDKFGQTVDLTPAVAQYQAMIGQGRPAPQPVPQYAPEPMPAQTTVINQQAAPNNAGGNALATAAAAGMGAMAGAAMSNSYGNNGVPYGTPMYYRHGAAPYYMGAGNKPVTVNSYNPMYNVAKENNYSHQTTVNAEQNNSYNAEKNASYNAEKNASYNAEKNASYNAEKNGSYNAEKGASYNAEKNKGYNTQAYEQNSKQFEQQQEYYQKQKTQNPEQYKSWQQKSSGENPFVRKPNEGSAEQAEASQQRRGEAESSSRGEAESAGRSRGGRRGRL